MRFDVLDQLSNQQVLAKIKNIRQNMLHQFSHKLVNEHAAIFVGSVNAKALAQTKLAKSVLDASWTTLRTMLKYKCENAGVWYEKVNEAYTTQTCSCCGSRSSSPKGRAGLGIRYRDWETDRKSTRLNSSHSAKSRMPSSA